MKDLEVCAHQYLLLLQCCPFSQLEEIWSSSTDEDEDASDEPTRYSASSSSGPIWQMVFFLLMWQSLYRVSNAAISILLKFISTFVHVFGRAFTTSQQLNIPNTISSAQSYIFTHQSEDIHYFVVCPSCDSIYEYEECFTFSHGRKQSKCCKHIAYPNHPNIRRRSECGAQLLKSVKSGKT